jgi:FtsZ-binding cell division protein ZapB
MNSVESTLDELKEKREALTQEHQLLQKNEQEVVKSLTDKYGNGNLDVDSGIFTPNK